MRLMRAWRKSACLAANADGPRTGYRGLSGSARATESYCLLDPTDDAVVAGDAEAGGGGAERRIVAIDVSMPSRRFE
jgi:hypothetical protein